MATACGGGGVLRRTSHLTLFSDSESQDLQFTNGCKYTYKLYKQRTGSAHTHRMWGDNKHLMLATAKIYLPGLVNHLLGNFD